MSPVSETPLPQGWHLDRRIPIALIVFLLTQTIGLAWFLADLNAQVMQGEVERTRIEARLAAVEIQRADMAERITRLEVKLDNQSDILSNQSALLSDILEELRSR